MHEWYADGVTADSLLLGASMTKSALAHLVGNAIADGALRLDDEVVRHVPELAGSGYAGCTVGHVLTMTTRHRLGRGPPRPGRPGHAADLLLRRYRRQLARPARRGRAAGPSRHALGVQHRRLPGARLGARAGDRHDVRRGDDRPVGCARLRPRRGRRGRLRRGGPGRGWPGRLRGGLAAAGGAAAHRHGVPGTGARRRVGDSLVHPAAARGWSPAGCPARSPRTPASATTGGR